MLGVEAKLRGWAIPRPVVLLSAAVTLAIVGAFVLVLWLAGLAAALGLGMGLLAGARPALALPPRSAMALTLPTALAGAAAVGADGQLGTIQLGALADLIAIDLDQPHLQPVFDPAATVVYAAGRGDVTDVWVGGAPVVRDRRPMRVDPSGVTAELAALRARVLATLD